MSLDYSALWNMAKEKAAREVDLLYPVGDKRKTQHRRRLEHRYYMQYITPPRLRINRELSR